MKKALSSPTLVNNDGSVRCRSPSPLRSSSPLPLPARPRSATPDLCSAGFHQERGRTQGRNGRGTVATNAVFADLSMLVAQEFNHAAKHIQAELALEAALQTPAVNSGQCFAQFGISPAQVMEAPALADAQPGGLAEMSSLAACLATPFEYEESIAHKQGRPVNLQSAASGGMAATRTVISKWNAKGEVETSINRYGEWVRRIRSKRQYQKEAQDAMDLIGKPSQTGPKISDDSSDSNQAPVFGPHISFDDLDLCRVASLAINMLKASVSSGPPTPKMRRSFSGFTSDDLAAQQEDQPLRSAFAAFKDAFLEDDDAVPAMPTFGGARQVAAMQAFGSFVTRASSRPSFQPAPA